MEEMKWGGEDDVAGIVTERESDDASYQAEARKKMIVAPRLLVGLMPVPAMRMVAKWTKNTTNPMGRGAKIGTRESLAFLLASVAEKIV